MKKQVMAFRLAFRVEGGFWNAYLAKEKTMDDAIIIGSIRMEAVADEERRDRFMGLMKETMSEVLNDAIGVRPERWGEYQEAPEHERAGNA